MTDWPDDWFRDGAGGAGAKPAGVGAEPPTVGDVGAGANRPGGAFGAEANRPGGAFGAEANRPGGAFGAGAEMPGPTAPGGRPPPADQLTQPGTVRSSFLPGQPGAAGAGSAGSAWPEQPALYAPNEPRRAGRFGAPGMKGWRRWLRPRPIALVLVAIISLAVIGTVATYFYLDSKLTKKNFLVDYPGRPAQGAGSNWLITGSDSRQGLTNHQIRQFSTGFGVSGSRSDTIMVVHMPANGGRPVLMSIPRDSWVSIPGYGYAKINAAFSYGGPALLAKTVQNLTDLRIDHYMGIGFGGFVRVVDAIGGVRICLKAPLDDPASGLHLTKGCHTLSGGHALGFVRSRHQFTTQDLQRVQNQRIFLRALLRKLTSTGVVLNPFNALPAASDVAGSLAVDQGTSLYQLLQVARALRNPITTTAPIANSNYFVNGQDALQLDSAGLAELVKDLNTDHRIPRDLISGSSLSG
jgi:LCP family protein required for cell wall assembly